MTETTPTTVAANSEINIMLDRCKVTKQLLDDFSAMLSDWKESRPGDFEINLWVDRLDAMGLSDWLKIGDIDGLRSALTGWGKVDTRPWVEGGAQISCAWCGSTENLETLCNECSTGRYVGDPPAMTQ